MVTISPHALLTVHQPMCMSACHGASKPTFCLPSSFHVCSLIRHSAYRLRTCHPTRSPIRHFNFHPVRRSFCPSARTNVLRLAHSPEILTGGFCQGTVRRRRRRFVRLPMIARQPICLLDLRTNCLFISAPVHHPARPSVHMPAHLN